MLPQEISIDIIEYLQKKKGMSIDDIAKTMGSTDKHIQKIINKKTFLTAENLESYLNNTNTSFWELAIESNLLQYLPSKIKKNVILCQQISQTIKKKKKQLESE